MNQADATKKRFPTNVVGSVGGVFDGQGEETFLLRLFDCLREQMGEAFERFEFVVHRRVFGEFAGSKIDLLEGNDRRVLIVISDEKEAFPVEEFLSYRAVFRSYGCAEAVGSNVHSFPVGYFNAAGQASPVPFASRSTSAFFSGCLNRNRLALFRQFRPIPWLPDFNFKGKYAKELLYRVASKVCRERSFDDAIPGAQIGFTPWFGQGLPPDEYAKVLSDSKIAICPAGFHSNETIRHWEAMRLGCVVISEPLPKNRFYRGSPIIELSDWNDLVPLINDLLGDPESLLAVHQATSNWWKSVCSESAVAGHIASVLADRDSC